MNRKKSIKSIRGTAVYKKLLDKTDAQVRLAVEVNEARILKGWSQQKLAETAETTQKVISKIESGDINIGFDLLLRITRCLNVKFQIGKTVFVSETGTYEKSYNVGLIGGVSSYGYILCSQGTGNVVETHI